MDRIGKEEKSYQSAFLPQIIPSPKVPGPNSIRSATDIQLSTMFPLLEEVT